MTGNNLQTRINGINITRSKVRNQMVDGSPTGKLEIVIDDPVIGNFAIDDSFLIEVRDMTIPAIDRSKMVSRGWIQITVADLLAYLVPEEILSSAR